MSNVRRNVNKSDKRIFVYVPTYSVWKRHFQSVAKP